MSLDINCDDIPTYIRETIENSTDKEKAISELKAENIRKKKLLTMRVNAHKKALDAIKTHPKGATAGLDAVLTNDTWARAKNANIEYTQKALEGYTYKFMPTTKQELSTGYLGLYIPKQQKQLRRDFVKAVMDHDKSNPLASKMAKETKEALDFLRERGNRFGMDIGKLHDNIGYLPQTHDAVSIRAVSKEEWTSFTKNLVDQETLHLINSGKINLRYVYDTIATGGLSKTLEKPSTMVGGSKSIANKHSEERVLNFRDGNAWLEYQERFGAKDPLAAIDDHIRTMTRDIALLEVLGTNPDNMFKTLLEEVRAINAVSGKEKPFVGLDQTQKMYNVVSGKVDIDKGEFVLGTALQTMRGIQTATLLNNAAISTITDPLLGAFTAGTSGMNPLSIIGGYAKNIVRSTAKRTFEDEQILGLGADVFSSEVTRRFSEIGETFWATASEAVMRGTLMNVLTESARMSVKTQLFKKMLGKRKLSSLTADEHISLLAKVQEEADYFVIMGDTRARAITTQGAGKGTVTGEISRSTMQFLTFPMSFMIKQGSRLFRHERTLASRAGMTIGLATLMTAGGALAMMGKDASKGYGVRAGFNPFSEDNDAEDVRKFWSAAALQGMGIGILGDFIFSDVNRFGNSLDMTLGGPSFGMVSDTVKLTKGNVQEFMLGEDTNFGSELVEYTNRHLNPVKTWYTQAVWNEYAVRTLKIMLDPDYEKKERRIERKRRKDYGQEKMEWLQDSREKVVDSVGAYDIQDGVSEATDTDYFK